MKAKDLRERTTEDLTELKATLSKDLFSHKMKNFTGQLDDTSLIAKTRKALVPRLTARVRARLAAFTPWHRAKASSP